MQGLRHYTLVLAIMDSDEEAYNIFNARSSDESEPEPQESSSSEEYGEEEPDVNTSSASDEPDIDERAPRASNIFTPPQPTSVLHVKVQIILGAMKNIGTTPIEFLDGLSWGDLHCIRDAKIRTARTSMLHDDQLEDILHRWAHPPRSSKSKKARAEGASKALSRVAASITQDTIQRELGKLRPDMELPPPQDVQKETLTATNFTNMTHAMQLKAPTLCSLLANLMERQGVKTEKKHRNLEKALSVLQVIFIMLTKTNHLPDPCHNRRNDLLHSVAPPESLSEVTCHLLLFQGSKRQRFRHTARYGASNEPQVDIWVCRKDFSALYEGSHREDEDTPMAHLTRQC